MTKLIVPLIIIFVFNCCSSHNYVFKQNDSMLITLDSLNWFLSFKDDGFSLVQQKIESDKSIGYFMFSHKSNVPLDTTLNVSFFIEPINNCYNAKCCRDNAWNLLLPTLKGQTDVSFSQIGEAATYEYMLPEMFLHKSMNAHFYKDGYWIDMHISRLFFNDEAQQSFIDLVKSVKFILKSKSSITGTNNS
jgi:hypothetical protein